MMGSPAPSDDSDTYEPWDPFEISSQQNSQANKLELCPYAYDEDPPIYIHYSIEWNIAVDNRAIMSRDTEQDLVLELSFRIRKHHYTIKYIWPKNCVFRIIRSHNIILWIFVPGINISSHSATLL